MIALITGASSGIGRDMSRYLNQLGYDIIITARDEKNLKELKNELESKNNQKVDIILADLTSTDECKRLYRQVKEKYGNIDLLINNAGFGDVGYFTETDLNKELEMIDTNIKAVHLLTKFFVKDMEKNNFGYILNVASSAAFQPGPLIASYYATKAYVLHLTEAIYEELRRNNSNVYIGALCPGPVDTEFNDVAKVHFSVKSIKSYDVAKYGIKQMFKRKLIIVPSLTMKLTRFLSVLSPTKLKLMITYNIQKSKQH